MRERLDGETGQTGRFLDALADPRRAPIAAQDVALVVAHPDDETIGCGAQLNRLQGMAIVMVTDGAPIDLRDARARGFDTARAYAAARRQELQRAMAIAGAGEEALIHLAMADQQATAKLIELTLRLAEIFLRRGIAIALTHAFEGGHPDHDATAFAVHTAAMLLGRRGRTILIIEMPFYRLGGSLTARFTRPRGRQMVTQRFAPANGCRGVAIRLSHEEQAHKRRVLAAYASQRRALSSFGVDVEQFRCAPSYDFASLPNGGRLLYERHDWGITGERWCALARAAQSELGV
jgi:N-acetylglucosamine malate deacetylase 2